MQPWNLTPIQMKEQTTATHLFKVEILIYAKWRECSSHCISKTQDCIPPISRNPLHTTPHISFKRHQYNLLRYHQLVSETQNLGMSW
jgi:hypothetical protein